MRWKLTTYDYRPPVQGGNPIFDGSTPYTLPDVPTDGKVCSGPGWHSVSKLEAGYKICSMWTRAWAFEPTGTVVEDADGNKIKSSGGILLREATDEEYRNGILATTEPWAGNHTQRLVDSQRAWQVALSSPAHDPDTVAAMLAIAIAERNLEWSLRFVETARDTRATLVTRDARGAWVTRDARIAARDAWVTRVTRDASYAWDTTWAATGAWDTWTTKDIRIAWTARDAFPALIVETAALLGWHGDNPELLTIGLREACHHGLAIAVPTGYEQLDWAMK